MKRSTFGAIVAIAMVALGVCPVAVNAITTPEPTETAATTEIARNPKFDGMHFNTENVVEIFYYGPGPGGSVCYITYDNPDQNLEYAVIRISEVTYEVILDAIESDRHIDGDLYLSHVEDGAEIYSLEY